MNQTAKNVFGFKPCVIVIYNSLYTFSAALKNLMYSYLDESWFIFTISLYLGKIKTCHLNMYPLHRENRACGQYLDHRLLTGGPWTPRGSVDGYSGAHKVAVIFLNNPKMYLLWILSNILYWLFFVYASGCSSSSKTSNNVFRITIIISYCNLTMYLLRLSSLKNNKSKTCFFFFAGGGVLLLLFIH